MNAGRPGDGAHRRAANPDADLREHSVQDPRRASGSRGCRTPITGRERKVALLAGGTGGAKLAAGRPGRSSEKTWRSSSTPPTTSRSTACTSRRTRTSSPTGSRARSTRSAAGASATTPRSSRNDSSALGAPSWFELTDRDLATCLYRTRFVAEGGTLTAAQEQIAPALGVSARVLPMSEDRVRTRVRTPAGWRGLQEFLILDHGAAPIEGVEIEGIAQATPAPEVLEALGDGRRDRDRPVQPRDLDRPDPLAPRHPWGDRRLARTRRRGEPIRRGPCDQGPDGGLHGRHRAPGDAPRASPRYTRACSTRSSSTPVTPTRRRTASRSSPVRR